MAQNSKIEWTDHTFNPVRGCAKTSPGCANCYAARESKRFPNIRGIWGDSGTRIVAVPDAWKKPLLWNSRAEIFSECTSCGTRDTQVGYCFKCGAEVKPCRPRVFCASLADVFEDWKGDLRFPADIAPEGWVTARWNGTQLVREFNETPMREGWRKATMDDLRTELFQLIEVTPNLNWQLLTKRPQNVMRMVPKHWREKFPDNVWMGTTVEDQQRADERIPELLAIPARVRFLSCEPLLGPVKLFCPLELRPTHEKLSMLGGIHQVIIGGESGPNARPMHPDWARSLRDQCVAAGVPVFFKQWGEWGPWPSGGVSAEESGVFENASFGEFHGGTEWIDSCHCDEGEGPLYRVGKKKAGRLLEGREWNDMPLVS